MLPPAPLAQALAERYDLRAEIGSGGTATVYLAEDTKHRRQVAIKVLRPEFTASLTAERFLREIETVARLQHPHILPLLDSGEAAGRLYFVMPFVEGETLRVRLQREGRLAISETIRILADLADALAHAHERGIVHRDIKPDNIMFSGRHAVVTDFGVAKAAASAAAESARRLTVGVALGTPTYMAPEQATASPTLDHRVDIYALGVLGYELLTGRPPFTGPTAQDVLTAHVALHPEPVEVYREDTPPALARVIMRCLEKRPEDRFQSAAELQSQLEPLATPSGGVTPTQALPVRRRVGWVAGATFIAALGVLASMLVIQPGRPDSAALGPAPRQRQLTFTGDVLESAISPDAQFLAMVVQDTTEQRLLVRDMRGGGTVEVAAASLIATVDWSADGSEVRYRAWDGTGAAFYVVPRLGGTRRRLTPDLGIPSPDGARLAVLPRSSKLLSILGPEAGDSVGIQLPFDHTWSIAPVWSPRGDRLVILTSSPERRRSSLIVVTLREGIPPREILAGTDWLLGSVWAPAGDALYFLRQSGQVASLMRVGVAPDGRAKGEPTVLVTGLQPAGVEGPDGSRLSLSADGRVLVYTSEGRWSNLARLPVGGDLRRDLAMLSTGTAQHLAARFSPDGQRIAFTRTEGDGVSVNVMPASGGPGEELGRVVDSGELSWGGDGTAVVVSAVGADTSNALRIFRLGRPERQSHLAAMISTQLDWSPSGPIVYQRPGNNRFGLFDPASGADSLLPCPDGSGWVFRPRISPDGRVMAFAWNPGGGRLDLWLLSLADGTCRRITSINGSILRWAGDGRRVFITQAGAGMGQMMVSTIPLVNPSPTTLQTLPPGYAILDITPDGRSLLLSVGQGRSDAWVVELPERSRRPNG